MRLSILCMGAGRRGPPHEWRIPVLPPAAASMSTRSVPFLSTRTVKTFWSAVVLTFGSATLLQGQVGLSSGVAQVVLTVRAAPRAAVQAVSGPRETDRQENLRSVVVSLRFSANSACRLVVRSTNTLPGSRVWVRGVDGAYVEVVPGSALTVARDGGSAGILEREVSYRIESHSEEAVLEPPVRYEIAVEPTI
jgi:hypothetical protein